MQWLATQAKSVTSVYRHVFVSANPRYAKYLKASQCGVVRLDVDITPAYVKGLCTDGLSACVALIWISRDGKRIALSHTDLAVSGEAIMTECDWIGDNSKMYIIRGRAYQTPASSERVLQAGTLPRFRRAIARSSIRVQIVERHPHATSGAVAVKRNGEIVFPAPAPRPGEFVRVGYSAPLIEFRHAINMLHANLLSQQRAPHGLDVQYDGSQWTSLPEYTDQAYRLVVDRQQSGSAEIDREIRECSAWHKWCRAELGNISGYATQLYRQQKFVEAIFCYKIVLNIGKTVLRDESVCARCHYNIGSVYHQQKLNTQAIEHLTLALEWRQAHLGDEHASTVKVRRKLAELSEQAQDQLSPS